MWTYNVVIDSLKFCSEYIQNIDKRYSFDSHNIAYNYLVNFNNSHKNLSIHDYNVVKNLLLSLEDTTYHKKYIRDFRKIKINKIEKL
jgi:hypothetical protein